MAFSVWLCRSGQGTYIDIVSQALKRKYGSFTANITKGDVGLDAEDTLVYCSHRRRKKGVPDRMMTIESCGSA